MMDSVPILFQDGCPAVCEKPAGLLSEGEGPGLLSRQLGCPISPVHRLDRGTAGLMVFAKTPASAAALPRAMGENRLGPEDWPEKPPQAAI